MMAVVHDIVLMLIYGCFCLFVSIVAAILLNWFFFFFFEKLAGR